jgi:NAD(P)-dependent dehydrogenase (short-subunit alcohol dehydrogenase family)
MAETRAGSLDGKVAIVTGAGRGLGRAMTLGLLDAGARVAAVELDAPAIEETQDVVEIVALANDSSASVPTSRTTRAVQKSYAPRPNDSAASTS